MKNDKTKVAKLAAHASNPGRGAPGAAKPVEVEVELDVALLAAAPVAELALELEVDEGTPNSSPVRVPTVVNTRAPVLLVVPVTGGYASQKVAKRVMTARVSEQTRERGGWWLLTGVVAREGGFGVGSTGFGKILKGRVLLATGNWAGGLLVS